MPLIEVYKHVTQAEVLNDSSIAASNFWLDGEIRSQLNVYPVLTTAEVGSVVVDQDTYVLHPVGTAVCFESAELTK